MMWDDPSVLTKSLQNDHLNLGMFRLDTNLFDFLSKPYKAQTGHNAIPNR